MPTLIHVRTGEEKVADRVVDVTGSEAGTADSYSPPSSSAPLLPTQRICSGCYLSEDELNRTGLLGCPRCYQTFAPLIASAVEILHGIHVPEEWSKPKSRQTVTNPWPTRRGIRIIR